MSAQAARRARIARIRTLEHRIAGGRLAAAAADRDGLGCVWTRLSELRKAIMPTGPLSNGAMLAARFEAMARLDRGLDQLAAPMADAEAKEQERGRERVAAWRREQAALALRDAALAESEKRKARRS